MDLRVECYHWGSDIFIEVKLEFDLIDLNAIGGWIKSRKKIKNRFQASFSFQY